MFKKFVPLQLKCLPDYSDMIPGAVETARYLQKDLGMKIGSTTGIYIYVCVCLYRYVYLRSHIQHTHIHINISLYTHTLSVSLTHTHRIHHRNAKSDLRCGNQKWIYS